VTGDLGSELADLQLANAEAAATIGRMRKAALRDREYLVFANRSLAGIITATRRYALASDGEPWAADVLRILGDAGVCTISMEDREVAQLIAASSLSAPGVAELAARTSPAEVAGMRRRVREIENDDNQEQQ
jgi:hypothetical protein